MTMPPPRHPLLAIVAAFVAGAVTHQSDAHAAPPAPERRAREPEHRSPALPEPTPPADTDPPPADPPIVRWQGGGCPLGPQPALARALLGLPAHADGLLSVEAWADSDIYIPNQSVKFHLRVSRRSYVTLFWLGPDDDIFIPFTDLPAAAERDLVVDADVIVTPPLGQERWVVVVSPERLLFRCNNGPRARLAWVERLAKVPHAIGRWEVKSQAAPPPERRQPPTRGRPR